MFRASSVLLIFAFITTTLEQSIPISPCPNVFQYEQTGFEPGQWYGVVNLSTDTTLHSLWLDIVLDRKANILGNWVGDVTTSDNMDFKIENTKMKIHPGPAVPVRFFVRYDKLNKAPKLQAILLNGKEICNANNRIVAIDRPDLISPDTSSRPNSDDSSSSTNSRPVERPFDRPVDRPVERPVDRPDSRRPVESRPDYSSVSRPVIRPEDKPITRPIHGKPSGDGPVYTPTQNPPIDQSNINPYSISPNLGDYFDGRRQTFIVSGSGSNSNSESSSQEVSDNRRDQTKQCGKVLLNSPLLLIVNGKPTLEGQWPWQIALYQMQTVDSKYICGGTLVTHKHIITAAHCVTLRDSTQVVNEKTLTVYLGKHNLRTSAEGVQIRLVSQITVHPKYNATSYNRDLSILKLRDPVQYTDYVIPACLWPENLIDLSNVVGKAGSVVGWGYDDTGVATEELTLVQMPVVSHLTCIRSFSEFFSRFTTDNSYCAGYRDGTSVCNGDSGGGMVFEMQGIWYLRGLVSLSVARHGEFRCDTSHYVIFTDLAKFLPWIKDHISDY